MNPEFASCCIVGAGPAGMMLALLLARAGVPVTLLEAHASFDRDFRGDTLHPYTLELLDQLGLVDPLLELPHRKLRQVVFRTAFGNFCVADFTRLRSRFGFEVLMPQVDFLNFLADQLLRYPHARLIRRANVQELLFKHGVIAGVAYQDDSSGRHEVRAVLTVGADGRRSRVREMADLAAPPTSPSMDILWLRLPRYSADADLEQGIDVVFGAGHFVVVFNRPGREWQLGFMLGKRRFSDLRKAGIDAFRRQLTALLPHFADRIASLKDFQHMPVLAAEARLCPRWWRPGLLLIGDAAHVMSPVGGIGIQYAIQDAVATANHVAVPLRQARLRSKHLAAVQRQRYWPCRSAQWLQRRMYARIIQPALEGQWKTPWLWHLKGLCRRLGLPDWPALLLGYGFFPPRLQASLVPPFSDAGKPSLAGLTHPAELQPGATVNQSAGAHRESPCGKSAPRMTL